MSRTNIKRISYASAALALIAVEVLIALFVNDSFVRPYVGDMLVVVVIWAIARAVIPEGVRLMPLYVFMFAAAVELMQYFDIVRLLGLENNRFFSILIGSTADLKDVACYAAGCLAAAGIELIIRICDKEKSDNNSVK